MNKEEDYASDSDDSDEDFCPDKATGVSDIDGSDDDSIDESKHDDLLPADEEEKKAVVNKNSGIANKKNNKCCTRQASNSKNSIVKAASFEKDELESDEEIDKIRSDALWADFLGDVKSKSTTVTTVQKASSANVTNRNKNKTTNGNLIKNVLEQKTKEGSSLKKIGVTELLDFADKEVHVQKDNIKENKTQPNAKTTTLAAKRPAGGGLSSLLNQVGKKKKLSILDKSKMDWNTFKQNEGLQEELQTYNKGKDGFLERQDFLQRTDLRQFEIEKNLRQSRRQK